MWHAYKARNTAAGLQVLQLFLVNISDSGVLYRSGSGVAVKKWTPGKFWSFGTTDTMLPVVMNIPSMLIPLSLFLKISIIVSAVMWPVRRYNDRTKFRIL